MPPNQYPATKSNHLPLPSAVRILEYVCQVVFGLFILLSAFSIAFSQVALGLAMVAGLVLWIIKRPPLSRAARLVLVTAGLYTAWMVLAAVMGERPWESLGAIREDWLFLIIPLGLLLMAEERPTRRLATVLTVALLLMGLYGIIQHFTGLYLFKSGNLHTAGDEFRISGGFSHPLTYGNYLATATLFVCAYGVAIFRTAPPWRRWLTVAAGVCGLVTVALCNSRGPMLSTAVGLIVLGSFSRRFIYGLVVVILTGLVFALVSPQVAEVFTSRVERDLNVEQPNSRLFIWNTALKVVWSSPLTGVGAANFGRTYVKHLPPEMGAEHEQGHAHNDFLHTAAIAGLPGLAFFGALWVVVIRQFWRSWRDCSLSPPARALILAALMGTVTFLSTSMTEATFTDEEVRQLLMLLWAFGLSALVWGSAQSSSHNAADVSGRGDVRSS